MSIEVNTPFQELLNLIFEIDDIIDLNMTDDERSVDEIYRLIQPIIKKYSHKNKTVEQVWT